MKATISAKKIGVWMDHRVAHFIDINGEQPSIQTIYSGEESHVRNEGESSDGIKLGNNRSTNNEYHHHHKENEILGVYFKILMDRLKAYDDIYILGPTTAKDELTHRMNIDKHFLGKAIHSKAADQLTENQMIAEVKQFFTQKM